MIFAPSAAAWMRPIPANQPHEKTDDGKNQKQMDESSHGIRGHKSENPHQ
jgi:hypothetical protein